MKLLREPLLHFAIIGAAIYLLYGLLSEPMSKADDKTIVVSAGEIEAMQAFWQKRWNRPPTKDELNDLIEKQIRETVLYREALAMRRKLHGEDHPDVATSLNDLAVVLKAKGDFVEAEKSLREALSIRRQVLGEAHLQWPPNEFGV